MAKWNQHIITLLMCDCIKFEPSASQNLTLPLSNGRVDATLNGAKAFLKMRKDNTSMVPP
ncbi:hypothetical protein MTR_8g011373 [Medicago truncatula]|uniref:Uncharacterized protein n=1 Tax=Medicago truncatula TaxID=3880 RepID=A0A072TML9_MEDTR|nr:hypothetical protein MTR_8g011373 [Medicago truncatula]